MRLVNKKLGCGDSGNVLNEGVITSSCLHAVDEDTGVRDEYYLTIAQIMTGDYRQRTIRFALIPCLVYIQIKETE